MNRLDAFPSALRQVAVDIRASQWPYNNHVRLWNRGYKLMSIGNRARVVPPTADPVWMGGMLAPCLFVAAVGYGPGGDIQEAAAKHFSSRFSGMELRDFLRQDITADVERARIMMTGLAMKTSQRTLQDTCEQVIEEVGAFGIPLRLEWEKEDRPHLIDTRNGQPVSDLGFGLHFPESRSPEYSRAVSFGATSIQAVLISTLLIREERLRPLASRVISPDLGVLTLD